MFWDDIYTSYSPRTNKNPICPIQIRIIPAGRRIDTVETNRISADREKSTFRFCLLSFINSRVSQSRNEEETCVTYTLQSICGEWAEHVTNTSVMHSISFICSLLDCVVLIYGTTTVQCASKCTAALPSWVVINSSIVYYNSLHRRQPPPSSLANINNLVQTKLMPRG